ncbi:hypothetical protein [Bifidobacterium simiarum]|uniref:hypothetical protein n=1 Tax=Bifidobacterium simiarum TaxID=2045441 RepID=UPI001A9C9CDE|nr:hypothetical protein [Bifidobacterium simiarum]MBT1165640.1 hypothetical protein [Bifidobacterium simiarum]
MNGHYAWIDESVRTQGLGVPTYFIGACICDMEEDEIRRVLSPLKPAGAAKLHWRDMTQRQKRRSIPIIQSLGLAHIVVAATPLDGNVASERARRKCLECLLPILETDYGVGAAIFESRSEAQDIKDYKFVQGLRSRRFIQTLRVDFTPGKEDARLWMPDQILGAIGDEEGGVDLYRSFTQMVVRYSVNLHGNS